MSLDTALHDGWDARQFGATMKIVKLSTLCPSHMVGETFDDFVGELARLSNRFGIAVATTGGVVMFDTERDCVAYRQNPCSGNLEPEITEIEKIKTASATFDFKSFSAELRELSDGHKIKLVSVGAMSGLDSGAKGTTYLAIWADGDGENQAG